MKLLVDMNLSPDWVAVFTQQGWDAVHWSTVGDPRAIDEEVLQWAKTNGRIVFTHDLDLSTLLALTHASGPSVIQVRTQDTSPLHLGELVVRALREYERHLVQGALVTVVEARHRMRILPI